MKSSSGRRLAIASGFAVAAVAWACGEPLIEPTDLDAPPTAGPMSAEDSVRVLATLPQLPPGLARAPGDGVFSDSMVLEAAGGFSVTLSHRECASPDNRITVQSPTDSTLSTTMCQQAFPHTWAFEGPFDSGDVVLLEFEKGSLAASRGAFQVSGSYPTWTVVVEDGFDNDFNDLQMTVSATPDTGVVAITLDVVTANLHPWIGGGYHVADKWQPVVIGDSTALSITLTRGGNPLPDTDVHVKAEFPPLVGGHSHRTQPIALDSVPATVKTSYVSFGAITGQPTGGFFSLAGDSSASLQGGTDSIGSITATFTAGLIGSTLDIIATADVDGQTYADTATVLIAVPGLVDASNTVENAYFVGGRPWREGGPDVHPQGVNWHVTAPVASKMAMLADALALDSVGLYVQFNDASLVYGGTFTIYPNMATGIGEDPNLGHVSHSLGIDLDVGFCYAPDTGVDVDQDNRIQPSGELCSTVRLERADLTAVAAAFDATVGVHVSSYHVGFRGAP